MVIIADVYPVMMSALPTLFAYRVEASTDGGWVGSKMRGAFCAAFGGQGVWSAGHIVTNVNVSNNDLTLWAQRQARTEPRLLAITNTGPTTAPKHRADYAASVIRTGYREEIAAALARYRCDVGAFIVERDCYLKGWVVNGQAGVAFRVHSTMLSNSDLSSLLDARYSGANLVGVSVFDKNSTFKGVITAVIGTLAGHRSRLRVLTKNPRTAAVLDASGDDEPVVSVRGFSSGAGVYDYAASCLGVTVTMETASRLGFDMRAIRKALVIAPAVRAGIVDAVAAVGVSHGIIGTRTNSERSPALFPVFDTSLPIRFARGTAHYDGKNLYSLLTRLGPYKPLTTYTREKPMRVGFISAVKTSTNAFRADLKAFLSRLGLEICYPPDAARRVEQLRRKDVASAFEAIKTQNIALALFFLPAGVEDDDDFGECDTPYHLLKRLSCGAGIPSQAVDEATMNLPRNPTNAPPTLQNIILGVAAKVGMIPFVFERPLSYADLLVGLDVAREKRADASGSVNIAATTRLYSSSGEFLRYFVNDAEITGETISPAALRSFFPERDFAGKTAIIHRDGPFRGSEVATLRSWAATMGARFRFVEVIKSGAPRLYEKTETIEQPAKGAAFLLSSCEAFVVSSLAPFKGSTPNPLYIRCVDNDSAFTIREAVESVLAMTLLHWGSIMPPRMPVTVSYSDKIAYLALRGVKPANAEGSLQYWL